MSIPGEQKVKPSLERDAFNNPIIRFEAQGAFIASVTRLVASPAHYPKELQADVDVVKNYLRQLVETKHAVEEAIAISLVEKTTTPLIIYPVEESLRNFTVRCQGPKEGEVLLAAPKTHEAILPPALVATLGAGVMITDEAFTQVFLVKANNHGSDDYNPLRGIGESLELFIRGKSDESKGKDAYRFETAARLGVEQELGLIPPAGSKFTPIAQWLRLDTRPNDSHATDVCTWYHLQLPKEFCDSWKPQFQWSELYGGEWFQIQDVLAGTTGSVVYLASQPRMTRSGKSPTSSKPSEFTKVLLEHIQDRLARRLTFTGVQQRKLPELRYLADVRSKDSSPAALERKAKALESPTMDLLFFA